MRDVQLVIFDCDGVLFDSEVISNDVLAGALTEQALPTTLAEVNHRCRRTRADCDEPTPTAVRSPSA